MNSHIECRGGYPRLLIDDTIVPAMAYTTYFEEYSCHEDFIRAGYRIFFVNVYFTMSPINSRGTGFTPASAGVFEDPAHEDYSVFEDTIRDILHLCPDAFIFPRIYISMPPWWVEEHMDECILTNKGGWRENLFSESFRRDACLLLTRLVRHIQASDYAGNVAGWQLCAGNTQEWFHPDLFGSLSPTAAEPYRKWAEETYGIKDAVLPAASEYQNNGTSLCESENARRYAEFANVSVAETLEIFAKKMKELTGYRQVVGAFYGYSFEFCPQLWGTHAMRIVVNSPALDFLSSPNSYHGNRPFGIDWSDMLPVDTIRHHGKIAFIECDIRTCRTRNLSEARPDRYPADMYPSGAGSVWAGPPTPELSREALRKCFAHQLTHGNAIWWFDMWGGWYHDPIMMEALADMKRIYDDTAEIPADFPASEVVLFADERAAANLRIYAPLSSAVVQTRVAMGNTGVPYDSCLVEDAPALLEHYRAAVFTAPVPSEAGLAAMAHCRELGIPFLAASEEHPAFTPEELRTFFGSAGVHIWADGGDVVYAGSGYAALHTAAGGEKCLRLPTVCRVVPIFGTDIAPQTTNCIRFRLEDNTTALFSVHCSGAK